MRQRPRLRRHPCGGRGAPTKAALPAPPALPALPCPACGRTCASSCPSQRFPSTAGKPSPMAEYTAAGGWVGGWVGGIGTQLSRGTLEQGWGEPWLPAAAAAEPFLLPASPGPRHASLPPSLPAAPCCTLHVPDSLSTSAARTSPTSAASSAVPAPSPISLHARPNMPLSRYCICCMLSSLARLLQSGGAGRSRRQVRASHAGLLHDGRPPAVPSVSPANVLQLT